MVVYTLYTSHHSLFHLFVSNALKQYSYTTSSSSFFFLSVFFFHFFFFLFHFIIPSLLRFHTISSLSCVLFIRIYTATRCRPCWMCFFSFSINSICNLKWLRCACGGNGGDGGGGGAVAEKGNTKCHSKL